MEDFKVQFGTALTADFEENTYTFEMQERFIVAAGEYAILPKERFEKLLTELNKEATDE